MHFGNFLGSMEILYLIAIFKVLWGLYAVINGGVASGDANLQHYGNSNMKKPDFSASKEKLGFFIAPLKRLITKDCSKTSLKLQNKCKTVPF